MALAGVVAGACDQGHQHKQITSGALVSLSGANFSASQPLPADGAVKLSFDRLLLPSSVNRQSVILVDAFGVALSPTVTYDPVARIVTLSKQGGGTWLLPDQSYDVIMHAAVTDEDPAGLRAIDRAPLFPGDPPRRIGFSTTSATGQDYSEPDPSYCRDVAPIFQQRCSASSCHGARATHGDPTRFGDGPSSPAAGLLLETSIGVEHAIGRVANGSNTGARSASSSAGRVFGIDMPLIDPGNPGNSWLMYKLLLGVPSDPVQTPPAIYLRCDARTVATDKTACTVASDCTGGKPGTGARCDAVTSHTCVDGCTTSSDCTANAQCDTTTNKCASAALPALGTPCKLDTDCNAGALRVCDAATSTCAVPFYSPPLTRIAPSFAVPMDDYERSVLSDFILGRQMPYPNIGVDGPTNGNPALTFEELERVRLWIAKGAVISGECVCE